MNGLALCFLTLAALPCVLGIRCYSCTPNDNSVLCNNAHHYSSANCTTDSCGVLRYTFAGQSAQVTSYMMLCINQSSCSAYKTEKCQNVTRTANATSCEMECCSNADHCNSYQLFDLRASTTAAATTNWQTTTNKAVGIHTDATFTCLLFTAFLAVMTVFN